ncbi:MAG: cysteine desulfurase [Patescibacteria group bacterium]
MFDIADLKKDFPIFGHHPKLVYLDSAATSLKPKQVIDAEREYYERYGVNVHRGVYELSVKATDAYEGAREKIRKFINAKSTKEIVFVRGTTEAINLVADSFGKTLKSGDIILLSEMEHHANIVPWFAVAQGLATPPPRPSSTEEGAGLIRWIPITDDGQLDLSNIDDLLKGVKLVAVTQMSNVLGTVNDVKTLARKAHAVGAKILVDAAQSVPHMPVDVQDLDADFLVFSGHKMLGPTGIGVLYAKQELLEQMEPYQRGGDMILEVTKEKATWNELPWKFEAGTPNIAGTIGLGAAVDYLSNLGMENVWKHEQELTRYGLEQLGKIPGVAVLGVLTPSPSPTDSPLPNSKGGGDPELAEGEQGKGRGAIFAFTIDGVHPHDIGSILDEQGVAVRAGHHCAMPLHQKFGLVATARASCYLYNTKEDIDALVRGIKKIQEVFA